MSNKMLCLKQKILVNFQSNYKYLLNNIFNKLLFVESDFITKESNWFLKQIDEIQLRTNKINLVRGETYFKLLIQYKVKINKRCTSLVKYQ